VHVFPTPGTNRQNPPITLTSPTLSRNIAHP
jgi:hypothetical protein